MFEWRKMNLFEVWSSFFLILEALTSGSNMFSLVDLAFIQEAERGLVEGEKGADFKSCCLQMFLHAVKVLIARQQSERIWFEQYLFVHFDESPVPKKASPNKNLPNLPVHWHNGITLLLIFGSLQGHGWIQYPDWKPPGSLHLLQPAHLHRQYYQ